MRLHRSTMLATALVASATSVAAQGRIGCASGNPVATLGTLDLECVQCTIHTDADRWIEYGAEPTVKRAEGGSEGLRSGDVIVSIDGALITTAAGSRRLANPNPDRPSSVAVRRDGKQLTLSIAPQLRCPVNVIVRGGRVDSVWVSRNVRDTAGRLTWRRDDRVMTDSAHVGVGVGIGRGSSSSAGVGFGRGGRVQGDSEPRSAIATARSSIASSGTARTISGGDTTYSMNRRGSDSTAAAGPRAMFAVRDPGGWLGFGIECGPCSVRTAGNGSRLWDFSVAPKVAGVEPGSPAARAKIETGDVIRAIDGLALTSATGARRFSTIRPDQRIRITIERNGKTREIQMTAGRKIERI